MVLLGDIAAGGFSDCNGLLSLAVRKRQFPGLIGEMHTGDSRETYRAVEHGLGAGRTVAGDGERVAVVGHVERARPRRRCREQRHKKK